ncbi:PAS domain-containing hybrid sensor histidine kinase/response regulator [Nostoc sp. 'Peltigera malacea cyanobiont' DB3992]|uniref:PAS domain-containing hybrid sensor histidine kinase/response regulator n=1 Tax=Nostoc sp. 'Peltigera malacea cyanobiont' DB3992 TaxID=1206980 RepID=UPI000C04C495|nr:PAS domain-containing sensor histidine kinase [Nostoc sp. 'Peltigera malacea cyanobiont' DB3992]PHM06416.1 hybrid sensor histidine kinase/response regulator [Nostoc sp. 'Peltigera malacea cyanobiont' DB3992]
MTKENFQQAIVEAHQRLKNLSQLASLAAEKSIGQDSPRELLQQAMTEISISLEELQQQNEELIATRHLIEAERQRYYDLFNFAPDGYLLTDATGIIQEANYAAAKLLNVRQSYLIGKPMAVFVHQTERQKFRQIMLQLQQQGQIKREELRFFHEEGITDFPAEITAIAVDRQGKTENLRWLFRDISEQQAALRERHQQEQKIREQAALLDITTDAIIVEDLHNQILFWNHGAEKMYGWQVQEAQGKNTCELLSKKTSPLLSAAQKTVIEYGTWQGELHKFTKNGKEIIIASRWTLMLDAVGLPKSILIVDTDITEKKQLETHLLHSQRLESLGTLASGIAHDLNNILTPIMGIAHLLPLKYPHLDDSSLQMLKILESNAKRGGDLVGQILLFTRGSEKKFTIVLVSQLLEDIKQIVQQTFPKFIDINTDIAPEIGMVFGDNTELHQVLMNLVVNARDAMPNGGKLSISATKLFIDENHARMHIGATANSYVKITVADTGVGIDSEIIDRIFDPFFTTKEVGKGTGLGLSILMGIVKSHGGFVEVASKVGIGTKFQVYLPSKEGSISQIIDDIELPRGQGELILVVDDEVAITQIAKTTLEIHNYKVLTAQNGIEAIALYTEHQDEIRLVLIDIMMPSMGGEAVISTLQTINPEVQIIAMSGLASSEALVQTTGVEIQGFLAKPFTPKQLLNFVQRIFR